MNASGGNDPWLLYYEGNYYLAASTWSSSLTMRRSPTLAGLKTAPLEQIYYEADPSRCCNMWAPEFHLLEGPDGPRWYFYYSAGTSGSTDNQHTHVLESAGTDSFEAGSTWWIRPGLADNARVSFEAYSRPGYYIGRLFGVTTLIELTDSPPALAREDATFLEER